MAVLERICDRQFLPSLLKVNLNAAGQVHYKKALGGSLDSTVAILNSANTFMASNWMELTDKGNMSVDFPTAFNTMGENFKALPNI